MSKSLWNFARHPLPEHSDISHRGYHIRKKPGDPWRLTSPDGTKIKHFRTLDRAIDFLIKLIDKELSP